MELKFTDSELRKTILNLSKTLDQDSLLIWATACAERVIPWFEEQYPNEQRPRKAIEAGRCWLRGELSMPGARLAAFAAHAAARTLKENTACTNAARAAGHAAATAHVKTHAVHAATYAAKAVFYHAAGAATVVKEREWQLERLLELGHN